MMNSPPSSEGGDGCDSPSKKKERRKTVQGPATSHSNKPNAEFGSSATEAKTQIVSHADKKQKRSKKSNNLTAADLTLRLEGAAEEREKRRTEKDEGGSSSRKEKDSAREGEEGPESDRSSRDKEEEPVEARKESRGTLKRIMSKGGVAQRSRLTHDGDEGNGANASGNGAGVEAEGDVEKRQLNPLVQESQDASVSSLQRALSNVNEDDSSLLSPLPLERLPRKSLGCWMDQQQLLQAQRRESIMGGAPPPFIPRPGEMSNMMVDDSALISFDSAEIACLFWLQVEAYRQACRLERENAGEGKTASSAAHGSSITTTQASSSHNAPVHNGKISSLGWPGSTWVANAQPILESHVLRQRIYQQHIAEDAPLRVELRGNIVRDISIELDALQSGQPSSTSSTSSQPSLSCIANLPDSYSPPSPTSSPYSPRNLQTHNSTLPRPPEHLFREAQRQAFLLVRKESFVSFLHIFFTTALEAMDSPQPIPDVVFEEFRREYSKSESPASADTPDDHGWHFLEATKGVRCLRKFYTGKEIGCTKAVGVVAAPAAQVFRMVMACSETRQEWDELYLSGKVTENLSSNTQLLYFSMRSLSKTVRKRDFVVARSYALLKGKEADRGNSRDTFVIISKSIPSAAHPPQKDFIRGEEIVEGWIIKETGNNSSLITRIVSFDFRGKIPASIVNALNHRLAITSVLNIKTVFDRIRDRTKELMSDREIHLPFVAKVVYPHQFITREECNTGDMLSIPLGNSTNNAGGSSGSSGSSANSTEREEAGGSLGKATGRRGVKINDDLLEEERKRDGRSNVKLALTDFPVFSIMEGELVTVLKKLPNSKLWVGFQNRRRGLINIDYIEPILPTLPSPSTTMIMNPGMVSLMEVLLETDCRVVFTLLSVVDLAYSPAIPEAIIRIHEVGGTPTSLIKSAITLDLSRSTALGTLFRGMEIHTSLLSCYVKTVAKKYLSRTLKPLIRNVSQLYEEGKSLEVDPARLKEGEVLEDNVNQLVATTRDVLEKILQSADECPAQLRDICRHLQREVSLKYPGTHYTALGGLFFLRLLCPAIVSPTERALVKGAISPGVRRGLVLVSKILQNLANGVEFGYKEAHMAILNPFIIEHLSVVHTFFDKLTDEAEVNKALNAPRPKDKSDVDTDLPQESLNLLHTELCRNLDAMADKFESEDPDSGLPIFERLLNVLTLLGPPTPDAKPTSVLKGHLRRLSFGKGSFIVKSFKQEREAQKEKEARIIMEKEKSEPVPLPVPSIEELMEEQSDVVGSEEVEFSPEQRRRAKLKRDKLEKLLGVALSSEEMSSQISATAPPVSKKDMKRWQANQRRSVRGESEDEMESRDSRKISDIHQQRLHDHLQVATVPGSTNVNKQKLVLKRHKLQKILGAHLSAENIASQFPHLNEPPKDDPAGAQETAPRENSTVKKKWWMSGSGATGKKESAEPESPREKDLAEFKRQLRRANEEVFGEDIPEEMIRRRTAPDRASSGLNNFMRKWSIGDVKERERKKSFISTLIANGLHGSHDAGHGGAEDSQEDGMHNSGSPSESSSLGESKPRKRKDSLSTFFRRSSKHEAVEDEIDRTSTFDPTAS